jgi:hypothetical protein
MLMQVTNVTSLSDGGASGNGGVIENYGSFNFNGVSQQGSTTVAMAFLNHGKATFNSGLFRITSDSNATLGASYLMDNTAGSTTTLLNGATLGVSSEYEQTGGLLTVADTTAGKILGLTPDTDVAFINGGKVQMGTATSIGSLQFTGGNVDFNAGEIDMRIVGGSNFASDLIQVSGQLFLHSGCSLVVNSIGTVQPNQAWVLISAAAIQGAFGSTQFPAGVNGPNAKALLAGGYLVTS